VYKKKENAEDSDIRNAKPAQAIPMETPAKVVKKNHQNGRTTQEVEIRGGSSAYRAIGHLVLAGMNKVEPTF
jgi:hypothetical protein